MGAITLGSSPPSKPFIRSRIPRLYFRYELRTYHVSGNAMPKAFRY